LNRPLPLPSDSFDTVLLMDVLEHLPRPLELFGEISRVLRRGGRLIIGVPFLYWVHEQPYDFYRYTEFALRYMCESNAFEVISLVPYGGLPDVFMDLSGKGVSAVWTRIGKAYVWGCQLLRASAAVQALSTRTNRLFPLGYTLVAAKQS
jgi:SAM-dependent methyltransferase